MTYQGDKSLGIPYGIRTRVAAVKGRCPRPLDERDALEIVEKTVLYNGFSYLKSSISFVKTGVDSMKYLLVNLAELAERRARNVREEAQMWDILARDLKRVYKG